MKIKFVLPLMVAFITTIGIGSVSGQPVSPVKSAKIAADLAKLGPGFPFEMTGTNHFYVEVKLNGEGPFRLIFDLGAPVTLLSNKAARDSKIVRRPKSISPSYIVFPLPIRYRSEHFGPQIRMGGVLPAVWRRRVGTDGGASVVARAAERGGLAGERVAERNLSFVGVFDLFLVGVPAGHRGAVSGADA